MFLVDTNVLLHAAQVHDARLAAIMKVYGIQMVLTYNPGDFARFDGILAIQPDQIA